MSNKVLPAAPEDDADGFISSVPFPSRWQGVNSRLLGLAGGLPMDPLVRLATFDDEQFERLVLEWAHGYLATKYVEVQARGRAGDKGRDLVAWKDPSSVTPRHWDLYQCKQYAEALAPHNFWTELGKLCFFTHRGEYTVPDNYFIVASKGVSNQLQDLIDQPSTLHEGLVAAWTKQCRTKITAKNPVELEGALRLYVDDFNFSIVRVVHPHELIEQHSLTKYHARVFGMRLVERPPVPAPPETIAPGETRYVAQVCEAYQDHLGTPVVSPSDFSGNQRLEAIFRHARVSFYSAEALQAFVSDAMPPESPYDSLTQEFYDGLLMTVLAEHQDGLARMLKTIESASGLALGGHLLASLVEQLDRVGICHQLANDDRFRWVSGNEQ
jgi:hypothetical protein